MMCDMANKHTWINERTNERTDGRTDQPTDGPSDRTNERNSLHYLPLQNEWLVPDYILLPRILAHIQIIHWPYPDEEFIVTGSHMTSRNQGSFSKRKREPCQRIDFIHAMNLKDQRLWRHRH